MNRPSRHWRLWSLMWLLPQSLTASIAMAAEPPCDRYATVRQPQCERIWKELNEQAIGEIAQFGLAQQARREAGELTPEQHLAENMAFIKQSTDRRLKKLAERMAAE